MLTYTYLLSQGSWHVAYYGPFTPLTSVRAGGSEADAKKEARRLNELEAANALKQSVRPEERKLVPGFYTDEDAA